MHFVEVVRQAGRVVFRDCENDSLPWPGLLLRREFLVALPGETVEFHHHLLVTVFIGPFALKLSRIVYFSVDFRPLRYNLCNAGGEIVWTKILFSKRFEDGKSKIRLTIFALVKSEGVSFDVR